MKHRASQFLLHGTPRGAIPSSLLHSASTRKWRPMQDGHKPYFSRAELEQLTVKSVATYAMRAELLWELKRLRQVLRNNKRNGVGYREGASIIRRMRHALDQLPDPRRLTRAEWDDIYNESPVEEPTALPDEFIAFKQAA